MTWCVRCGLPLLLVCLVGCVSTTITEREVGEPTQRVQVDLLPEPPRDEVTVLRRDDSVHLEVEHYLICRRREFSTVNRVRDTTKSVSTGSGVSGGIFGGIGLLALIGGGGAAGLTFLVVGGSIIGVSALRSGTTTEELPPLETEISRSAERCRQQPLADATVRVIAGGEAHEGTTDANGNVDLLGVAPGPIRVLINGKRPTHVRERKADAAPPEEHTPPPTPSATPPPTPTAAPSGPIPLPPPPPPPPGARTPD